MTPPTQQCILVVEDVAEIRAVWVRLLSAAGFQVIEAADGLEGIRKARQSLPDLILMDVSMPVLDGIDAVKQLKADASTARVPVIVISGDLTSAGRARKAGCELFLAKPVRASELLNAIGTALAAAKEQAMSR